MKEEIRIEKQKIETIRKHKEEIID